jgi:hypothetical protein
MIKKSIATLKFPNEKLLSTFLEGASDLLLDESNIFWFQHPKGINAKSWMNEKHQDFIKEKNKHITDHFHKRSCIYAIWEKRGIKIFLRYVGQTTDKTSKQRVFNHFIAKHPRTGSKLAKVQESIANGYTVGVTLVEIKPKQMRQYLEQMLIKENKSVLMWNLMGKGKD